MTRCKWCNLKNPKYVEYHDHEWGKACHDDGRLFEMLILEGFQAGLSWECILNKREAFRAAFDNFDVRKVAKYDEVKLKALAANPSIVRNRLKIAAAVVNAQAFIKVQQEFGSFDKYLWGFARGALGDCPLPVVEWDKTHSDLSDSLSKDLKKHGFKFVGTTIVYSLLQAVGIINSHDPGCYLHK